MKEIWIFKDSILNLKHFNIPYEYTDAKVTKACPELRRLVKESANKEVSCDDSWDIPHFLILIQDETRKCQKVMECQ